MQSVARKRRENKDSYWAIVPYLIMQASTALPDDGWWQILPTVLPQPLSDHTAVLVGHQVYIAGGCDSPRGNQYQANLGVFVCDSISQSFFKWDLKDRNMEMLPDLPTPRYRHAAVAVSNSTLWVLGGRNVQDEIVASVDVSGWKKTARMNFTQLIL